MGARVYLPALRQFLSRDPAGYAVSTAFELMEED
jgi:hypothetical protein